MPILVEKINMRECIGQNLALRESADKLFDSINLLTAHEIVLDFKGVTSISRSFSQQLLNRMSKCPAKVDIINQSKDIDSMFYAVKNPKDKYKLVEFNEKEVISFSF
ncbi:MAG: hypothetical protein QCI00_08300 [Candidatus Thermoplasmatota archaeon]|nr:hypothetical protein [Candidatus Thermoplasmatota archaeon]